MLNQILFSFTVTHGFLDFLKFRFLFEQTILYIIIILLVAVFYTFLPVFILFIFLVMSSIHFDMDYIKLKQLYQHTTVFFGNNITYINNNIKIRIGDILFLSTLLGKNNYEYWYTILEIEDFSKFKIHLIINIFRVYLLLNMFRILKKSRLTIELLVVYISILFIGHILGPFHTILYYLGLIHTPISIINMLMNDKNVTLTNLLGKECRIMINLKIIILILVITVVNILLWDMCIIYLLSYIDIYIVPISIGILIAHMCVHNTILF
jgi:hypothetical protein